MSAFRNAFSATGADTMNPRILFVCLGNICRSPMAEYLCRHLAAERGLAVATDSAGTSGWHDGEGMHEGTAAVLATLGLDGSGFVSRRIRERDFDDFDYLVAMDDDNLAVLQQRFGRYPDKIFKISDCLSDPSINHIPDPWYTGDFDETKRLLQRCCQALLDKIGSRPDTVSD